MARVWTLTIVLCAAFAGAASAQDPRGAITGRVVDGSGGRVPGATITAKNIATNVTSTAVTNREGLYIVPPLTPGVYDVTVQLTGFKKSVREGVEVRVGDRLEPEQPAARYSAGGEDRLLSGCRHGREFVSTRGR
jgi:hypothetical protein